MVCADTKRNKLTMTSSDALFEVRCRSMAFCCGLCPLGIPEKPAVETSNAHYTAVNGNHGNTVVSIRI